MCGIVGYASAIRTIPRDVLDAMRDTMAHRGPDGADSWQADGGTVGFGHRRLAIIDLTEGGHQPMASADGRYVVTYNGEIYNFEALRDELRALGHHFVSASDTEVLLAAYQQWGERALARLAGMFAFAIYDQRERTLFAARDRAGEKPFFYRHADGMLAFASELKALLRHPDMPRTADPVALDHYLGYGYVPRELCMLAGYAKLPAGSYLRYELDSDRLTVASYWQLPQWSGGREQSFDELADEFEPILDTAVRRQLVADVPLGILLSGGLDSSLVAATAVRLSGKVTTFTIGFPGHAKFDESPIAKRLAGDLGTNHVELMVEPDAVDLLPRLAAQFDEPIADSSMIPTFIVSRLVRSQATVALGGDGGDELFGGYPHHGWVTNFSRMRATGMHRLPGLSAIAGGMLPHRSRYRKTALRLLDRHDPAITVTRLLDPKVRGQLIRSRLSVPDGAERYRARLIERWSEQRERATALDFMTYMSDDILVKVDRSSMLTSLEVRAPLLDPGVIEFAFGRLAPGQRASSAGRKLLLRKMAERRLPSWFDSARKQGFSIPLAAWLKGPWKPLLEDLAENAGDGLLEPAAVRRFVKQGATADRLAHQMFQFAMLEMWRREYGITLA